MKAVPWPDGFYHATGSLTNWPTKVGTRITTYQFSKSKRVYVLYSSEVFWKNKTRKKNTPVISFTFLYQYSTLNHPWEGQWITHRESKCLLLQQMEHYVSYIIVFQSWVCPGPHLGTLSWTGDLAHCDCFQNMSSVQLCCYGDRHVESRSVKSVALSQFSGSWHA